MYLYVSSVSSDSLHHVLLGHMLHSQTPTMNRNAISEYTRFFFAMYMQLNKTYTLFRIFLFAIEQKVSGSTPGPWVRYRFHCPLHAISSIDGLSVESAITEIKYCYIWVQWWP